MVEIKVTCPECGKRVSLRGLNGHLRFEHDYDLDGARRIAAGIQVDGALNRVEQDVMEQVSRLYSLKAAADQLRQSHAEGIIGEALFERMISQKGQEMTAVTRYLQRLEETWAQRVGRITGVRPDAAADPNMGGMTILEPDEEF
ncbi:MAG: hypothetical protein O2782_07110 [bacterium]|nr:hypothetical protein [bacterium]